MRLSGRGRVLLLDLLVEWGIDTSQDVADEALALMMPVQLTGTIFYTAAATPPEGALVCDGSTYQREQYPELWETLADVYKTPDTFTVPDLLGTFIRGNTPGTQGGSDSVTLEVSNLPAHAHQTGNSLTGLAFSPGELAVLVPNPIPAWTSSVGDSQPFSTVPRWHGLLPCVWT